VRGSTAQGPHRVMALPALAYFGVFALLPLGGVVVLSLMRWDGIGDPSWAGLSR
jgi:raffinose/stachyose/melibiose transport system permease protein